MRYGSICSGIEAATAAWHGLGWEPAFFSEIENFPRAVLQHHYPAVPLHGDFTTINGDEYGHIDLLVGGTPCQDFSRAGLRAGLAGERGNLTLEFTRLVDRMRPSWVVWENVPGVLSIDRGRAFGAFLGALAESGYGFAYRVLDAQYFGLAQRRARVFVVGYLGDWRRAAAVLFERESLCGHPAPRREAGQRASSGVIKGAAIGRQPSAGPQYGDALDDGSCYTLTTHEVHAVAHSLRAGGNGTGGDRPPGTDVDTADSLLVARRAEGFDASEDGTGRGTPLVPMAFNWQSGGDGRGLEPRHTTSALSCTQTPAIAGSAVRRLTPRECERLQGFPDDWTLIPYRGKPAADGPRYKALGNSMAVPVMRWIGERVELIETLTKRIR